jgi:ABC-type dipeptide/oligopeptide/nickel transport system permease component
VQAAVLFLAVSFVLINLLVDILYQFIDPRARVTQ